MRYWNCPDRIMVLYEGQVMGIVDQKDATRSGLGLMMAGERATG